MKLSNYRGFNSAMLSMLVYEGFEPSLGNLKILHTVEDQAFRETIHLEGGTAFMHYSTKFIWDTLKNDQDLRCSLLKLGGKHGGAVAGYTLMAIKGDLPGFVTSVDVKAKRGTLLDRVMRSGLPKHQCVQYGFLMNPDLVFEYEVDALSAMSKAKELESDLLWSKAHGFKLVALDSDMLAQLENAWHEENSVS